MAARARRAAFLLELYRVADATGNRPVDLRAVGDAAGLPIDETIRVVEYLQAEGLLRFVTATGMVALTHAGLRRAERDLLPESGGNGNGAGAAAPAPTSPLVALSGRARLLVVQGSVGGDAWQAGDPVAGEPWSPRTSAGGVGAVDGVGHADGLPDPGGDGPDPEPDALQDLLVAVRRHARDLDLAAGERRELARLLAVLEANVHEADRPAGALRAGLTGLRRIVTRGGGSGLAKAVLGRMDALLGVL